MRSAIFAVVVKLLLLWANQSDAQTTQIKTTIKSCNDYSCTVTNGYGRGVNVGRDESTGDWIIVTAGHVLRDAESVAISDQDTWKRAEVGSWYVDHEKGWDIGIVRYKCDAELPFMPIGEASPAVNDEVQFISRGKYHKASVAGLGVYFRLDREALQGDSGGPVCRRGCAVGIVSNIDPGVTYCTPCEHMRGYLKHHGYKIREKYRYKKQIPRADSAIPPEARPKVSGQDARPSAAAGDSPSVDQVKPATEQPPPLIEKPAETQVADEQASDKNSGVDWWTIGKVAAGLGLAAVTGGGSVYLALARAAAPVVVGAAKKAVSNITNHTEDETTHSQAAIEGASACSTRAPFPRQLDEARQLRELRKREGRIPEFDALVGMVIDDEANLVFEKGTASEKEIVKDFVSSVKARANAIAPPSVEPYLSKT